MLSIVLGGFFLTSCEDVIQIDLDEGSKLYVIDAFVNSLPGNQVIRVTYNDAYFSDTQAPPVANASVVLTDLTANKSYVFNYSGNGNYVYTFTTDTLNKVNHQYQLNVTIDGYNYTSLVVQKRPAKIYDILPEYNDGSTGFGPAGPPFYFCNLLAKDKTDANTDYYWIKTYRNDTLFNGASDINISIDGTNGAVNTADFDSSYFTPPITFLGFKRYNKGDKCKVEVLSISRETYFFFVQASAQINNGGLFATTPENVKTNIVTPSGAPIKAVGWFDVSMLDSREIQIQ